MRRHWHRLTESAIEAAIRLCGVSAVLFVLGIFFFVCREAAPLFTDPSFRLDEFLLSTQWQPTSVHQKRYGVLAMFAGTVSVTLLSMLIATPLGIGAAIYISEFCAPRPREILKVLVELLAAIPSVVWGFAGLTITSRLIIRYTDADVGVNLLNGAVLLALMSIPVIVSLAEDAFKAVPDSYREASLAMGATRWQTVYSVLLPAARSGLIGAVLLGFGRAIGETMAVLMATGHAVHVPGSVFDPVRTLTANIAAELGEAPAQSTHYQVLFLIGVLLFLITFVVNLTAGIFIRKERHQ
jgi:phosphate transport system permease protein